MYADKAAIHYIAVKRKCFISVDFDGSFAVASTFIKKKYP
jgi:hypothetical protein